MKYPLLLLLLVLSATVRLAAQNSMVSAPDSVLAAMVTHFATVQNVEYRGLRELDYASENYKSQQQWTLYIDFTDANPVTGFRYQIADSNFKSIFNGSELFDLQEKPATMRINHQPGKGSFSSISALYNSFITIKNLVPLLRAEPSASKRINDTSISGRAYRALTVNIGKRRVQNLGTGFDKMTTESNFIYTIIIDPRTFLPVQVLQRNDLNSDCIKTSFHDLRINTTPPAEISWYYSSFTKNYAMAADQPAAVLLPPGKMAPLFALSLLKDGRRVSLNDYKGQVVLIDFWIKNCGPCIQNVPHLNELQEKFKSRHFTVLSVNAYDSKEAVRWFCEKHGVAYPVLLNGQPAGKQYGVSAFPSFFILDKKGVIIYAQSGYDDSTGEAIEKIIKGAL